MVQWDAGEAGLGVRVMPSGRKAWFWQGRRSKGHDRPGRPHQPRDRAQEGARARRRGGARGRPIRPAQGGEVTRRRKVEKAPAHAWMPCGGCKQPAP